MLTLCSQCAIYVIFVALYPRSEKIYEGKIIILHIKNYFPYKLTLNFNWKRKIYEDKIVILHEKKLFSL